MGAVDHRAQLRDMAFLDQPFGYCVLRLADGNGLRHLVGKDRSAGQKRGLNLLLALGVSAHAGDMRAGGHMLCHERRCKGRGDGDDDIRLQHALQVYGFKRHASLGSDFFNVWKHLWVVVPADDLVEVALLKRRAQLKRRLMARADHAHHLGILASQMLNRNRRRRRGAQGCQKVAAHHRAHHAGVRIKQKHRRLVVNQPALFQIVWPVSPGLEAKVQPGLIEAPLEPVKRVLMADRLAHHGKVIGISGGHRGKDLFNRVKGGLSGHQVRDFTFWYDQHCRVPHLKFLTPACFGWRQTNTAGGFPGTSRAGPFSGGWFSRPDHGPKRAKRSRPCHCARQRTNHAHSQSDRSGRAPA